MRVRAVVLARLGRGQPLRPARAEDDVCAVAPELAVDHPAARLVVVDDEPRQDRGDPQ